MRDPDGNYRVAELLLVSLADVLDTPSAEPLPLVRLPKAADEFRALGGDIRPGQVGFDRSRVSVAGPIPLREFQVVFAYRLPARARSFELTAEMPVDELILEIEQGSVAARLGREFTPLGEGGLPERPYHGSITRDLASDAVVRLELLNHRTDWRQRFAVLFGTALAVAAAAAYVWRGGALAARGSAA